MNYNDILQMTYTPAYDFLRTNPHLGKNIILLALGGSYAYGTNIEGSDIDIRGVAKNTESEILLGRPFEQVVSETTDTTIYSFTKIVNLLRNANPNVLEILFLDPDQYLFKDTLGDELIRNRNMFLSKKILYTFGGYARAQLNRLDNKSMQSLDQTRQEEHILRSIENASSTFPEKYFSYPEDAIRLYIDDAVNDDKVSEIFMDVNLKKYPLRDYKCMWSEMHNIVKDYGKIGKRAKSAMRRSVCKHAMHLVRLENMAIEALSTGTMHTHRTEDHDFLMDIRNGKYTSEDGLMSDEFYEIVNELEAKMKDAAANSVLPERPDDTRIDEFVRSVNRRIVLGQI